MKINYVAGLQTNNTFMKDTWKRKSNTGCPLWPEGPTNEAAPRMVHLLIIHGTYLAPLSLLNPQGPHLNNNHKARWQLELESSLNNVKTIFESLTTHFVVIFSLLVAGKVSNDSYANPKSLISLHKSKIKYWGRKPQEIDMKNMKSSWLNFEW